MVGSAGIRALATRHGDGIGSRVAQGLVVFLDNSRFGVIRVRSIRKVDSVDP
jgi:predicted RNA-binding protein with TRAM domain